MPRPLPLNTQAGQLLRELRAQKDLSQVAAAELLGMQAPSLNEIEQGKANLTLDRFERLLDGIGFGVLLAAVEVSDGKAGARG